MTSSFPKISKATANLFYYPGILIILITHLALLANPSMVAQAGALKTHAYLNLFGAALIAISWFGFCNTALGTSV